MDTVGDDHVPFRRAGIPAMDVIDFQYGGSDMDHAANWHTAADTIDKVCAESLQVVGDVIYHALPKLDALPAGPKREKATAGE
jgi:Zn-dependent M28 family amino/carboxypeptidase